MSWAWDVDETSGAAGRFTVSIVGFFAFIIIVVALMAYVARYSPAAASFLVVFLIITVVLMLISASNLGSISEVRSRLRGVEVNGNGITIRFANGDEANYGFGEISICYEVIRRRRFRAYNVIIKYTDGSITIPYLEPERFGELRQVLRGYGVEIEECSY